MYEKLQRSLSSSLKQTLGHCAMTAVIPQSVLLAVQGEAPQIDLWPQELNLGGSINFL